MRETEQLSQSTWLDQPVFSKLKLNWEVVCFFLIVVLAIFSRSYMLGQRVMSHDESLHTYYSWKLYRGEGYQHTPMMHGPLQFHMLALTYFLLGDNDFTARIPHAVASILSIVFLWQYRRYLGRIGTLIAAFLWLISPYMLYYGRYARNESLVGLFGLITIWGMLRYLESGAPRYLTWTILGVVLHFCSKETSFIYTAQMLLFLGFFFLNRIMRKSWPHKNLFLAFLILAAVLFGGSIGFYLMGSGAGAPTAGETAAPAVPGSAPIVAAYAPSYPMIALASGGLIALIVALFLLMRGFTLERLRQERSFDLIVLVFTLVLPHLVAFPVSMAGFSPTDYSTQGLTNIAMFLIPIAIISIAVGLWWNWEVWLRNAALFYGIFILFYTTLFTNGGGFFTGLVGSLGYWIEQQAVQRGSQPWYYYILIQVPIYEYLPMIGAFLAAVFYFIRRPLALSDSQEKKESLAETIEVNDGLAIPFLLFWTFTSFVAFSYAGEKMPWLTVHLAFGIILLAGWSFGKLCEGVDWSAWGERKGWLVLSMLLVLVISLPMVIGVWFGPDRPFQGKDLLQLQDTSLFILALVTVLVSGFILLRLIKPWPPEDFSRLLGLSIAGLLAMLTVRTAIMASYINYDQANEYLVYAHSARGVKDAMRQIEEISFRTTDGLAMVVGYDDDTSWPMTWYMRNYTNQRYFGNTPGKDLREATAIVVGDNNYGKIEPVVGKAYHRFDYIRMVWPNQDYFNLDWARIRHALTNAEVRASIFDIWLNRDFRAYGVATNQDTAINNWNPSDRMRLYLRKDVVAKIWEYGTAAAPEEVIADPYEKNHLKLTADQAIGTNGKESGQFQAPRNLVIASDGSLFVADSGNHRIQHIDLDGKAMKVWGTFGEGQNVAGGSFNEPWGIALGTDGSVFVSDTWNHRIQKFTPNGDFILSWGRFGQAETHESFWGPRALVADGNGRIFVADTGNKRIVIFNEEGEYISEFGGYGLEVGKFDEPVGLAMDAAGIIYVTDTWNQRIQSFVEEAENTFVPHKQWEVSAWYGQSLDNKPFVTVSSQGNILISDPEAYRIIEFTPLGEYVRSWGDYSTGLDGFGVVNGITADKQNGVWVCDAGNHRLLHFTLP